MSFSFLVILATAFVLGQVWCRQHSIDISNTFVAAFSPDSDGTSRESTLNVQHSQLDPTCAQGDFPSSDSELLQENADAELATITNCSGNFQTCKDAVPRVEPTDFKLLSALPKLCDCAQAQYNASVESGSSLGETDKDHKSSHESGLSPEKLSLGETLEDIMESSLLSRVAWTKILDEDGGRSYFEIFLRQLDDEQEDLTTELIESTLHQMLQVAFAFFAGSLSMCIMGSCGALSHKLP